MIILFNNKTAKNNSDLALLKHRIGQNYADFKAEVLCLMDEEEIFDMAHRIAAVKDCFEHMASDEFTALTDSETRFLLKFHNPLLIVADFLDVPVIGDDVEEAVEDAINAAGLDERYLTMCLADELAAKYGGGVPVMDALHLESVKAGERYVSLLKLLENAKVGDSTNTPRPFKPLNFDMDGFIIYEDDEGGCF